MYGFVGASVMLYIQVLCTLDIKYYYPDAVHDFTHTVTL